MDEINAGDSVDGVWGLAFLLLITLIYFRRHQKRPGLSWKGLAFFELF